MRAALAALIVLAGVTRAGPLAAAPDPSIIYLDFSDGSESVAYAGSDDAPTNRSAIGGAAPYPAFAWPTISAGIESRSAVIERITRRVHEVFLPYNVLITLTRPSQPPYTKVMIGGSPRDLGLDLTFAGVAYMDCGNAQPSNLVFVFPNNLRGDEHGLVVTIAQEAAHGFGLEHTMAPQDLMHPVLSPQQARFIDAEVSLLGDRICGNTTQNSHLKLIEAVGGWAGDDKPLDLGSGLDRVPPTLALAEPAPGAVVAQPLALRVEASDEAGIDRVTLLTPEGETVVRRPPFGFSLAGFPPGPLSFTLTAYDRSGNSATLSRAVTVTATAELPGCQAAPGRPQNAGGALPICVIVLAMTFAGRRRRVSPRSCCRAGSSPL